MRRMILLSLAALAALAGCTAGEPTDPTPESYMVMRKVTDASFDDVNLAVQLAITDRGFKIDNHAFIGRMLELTKETLGATETVYLNAQQYRFCPARYSRDMLSADPHNIAFCPYIINVYNLPAEPTTVYVMFRRPLIVGSPESQGALRAVEKLLNDIINEALSW